jgi:hypothetical protein
VHAKEFRVTQGDSLLSSWESSRGILRYFASCCGSPIYKEDVHHPDVLRLRLGTLDTDPGQKVSQHYMVDSVAPWVTLDDGLEKVAGGDGSFPGRR